MKKNIIKLSMVFIFLNILILSFSADFTQTYKNTVYEIIKIKINQKINDRLVNIDAYKLIIKMGNKSEDVPLYYLNAHKNGGIEVSYFSEITQLIINDMNKDKIPEIMIKGTYDSGLMDTCAYSREKEEHWYNFKKRSLLKIMTLLDEFESIDGSIDKYRYELTNINKSINCYHKIISYQYKDDKQLKIEREIKESYVWNGEKYEKKIFFKSKVAKLRMRKTPSLDGNFIKFVTPDDILEFIDSYYGRDFDIVNDMPGYWIKVKTSKNEVGYIFDYYAESFFDM
jgi:hypothetical protein